MSSGAIAFAPNVTPGTFNDPPPPLADEPISESLLFPTETSESTVASSSSRKPLHGRKKPENYIPRPPNAFILFRSAFIRSRHVSTGVETNHSTLSKIIGLTWQNLPEEERQVWHRKAKQAEAEHRIKFPQYAFKPLHSRKGGGKRKVREVGPKDQVRCAKIAEFLVQGLKGKELDAAIEEFDKSHVPTVVTRFEAPITEQSFNRPVSAPIPEGKKSALRKLRSSSSVSSRRSTPVGNSRPSPAPSPQPLASLFETEQENLLFSLPSLDHFSFDQMKQDPTFDFNSFAFDSTMQASMPSFAYDPHSQPTLPLDHTFSNNSPQLNVDLPQLHIDSSYVGSDSWSPCHSPCSPSTNTGSMPPTPAYSGSPLPDDGYANYHGEAPPAYTLHHKSIPSNITPSQFSTYQDATSGYNCAGQYTDLQCAYSTVPHNSHNQHSAPTDIDYSSFMASLPPYAL
ncbi:hypothetical protein D9611_015100 [Ephemerocybe angulata]|uniref:HMG box domain-containing protein n=1 Tax=Ephemerocybe angulata TaxID=980116 RepID=A0A8H5C3I1_9AGAR|nr:hypothetical protein D9611_015100 [Tulosesus angulatus]